MFVWWRDVLSESTVEGHHTEVPLELVSRTDVHYARSKRID